MTEPGEPLDPITGLLGRRGFVHVLRSLARPGMAVYALDLDRFGLVNALRGREEGDAVLRVVAERLLAAVGDDGVVARIGGDQFGVALTGVTDGAAAAAGAARLSQALTPPLHAGGPAGVSSCCIGYAQVRAGAGEEALDEAVTALRRAKDRGPATISAYDEVAFRASMRRYLVEHGLTTAVQRGELFLRYQPEIDLRTGRVVGAEALLRWTHPRLGDVPPAQFIAVAETSGVVIAIGAWVIEQAVAQAAAWRGTIDGPVWVNLSAAQLADPARLVAQVEEVLGRHALGPEAIGFEVTETALVVDVAASREALGRLRDRGIAIAVDDFGSGYASFTYLRNLPASRLKIDRSIIEGVGGSRADTSIVEAVIDLGHTLRLEVVAEGVETEPQAVALMRLGADRAQGFLFAPAVDPERFAAGCQVPWFGAELAPATLLTPRPAVLPGVSRGRGSLLLAVLDAMQDPVVVVDGGRPEPVVVYANRRFEALTGMAWHELTERPVSAVLPEESLLAAVRAGSPATVEVALNHPSAGLRWVEVRLGSLPDGHGLPQHRIGVVRDVTEERLVTRAARADSELLTRAAALAERLGGGDPLDDTGLLGALAAGGALLGADAAQLELANGRQVRWRRPGVEGEPAGALVVVPVNGLHGSGRISFRRGDAREWRPAEIAAARTIADGLGTAVVAVEPTIDLRRRAAFDGFRQRLARCAAHGDPDGFEELVAASCRQLAGLLGASAAWVELAEGAEPFRWPTGPVGTGPAGIGPAGIGPAGTGATPTSVAVRRLGTGRPALEAALGAGRRIHHDGTLGVVPAWMVELAAGTSDAVPIAAVAAPLAVGGRNFGVLVVTANAVHPWSAEDLALVDDAALSLASALLARSQERALRASEERFRVLADFASDMISLSDDRGVLQYVSRASTALLGLPPAELLGKRLIDFVHPDDVPVVRREIAAARREGRVGRCVGRLVRADGSIVWVETMIQPGLDAEGRVRSWHTTSRDITDRRKLEVQLAQLALYDALTGTANRMLLMDHIDGALGRMARTGSPFALVALDLDGFKAINDIHGHRAGDQALQVVAKRVRGMLRQTDTLARVGGDEFVVLCSDTDEAGALQVAERLVAAIATPMVLDEGPVRLGVSVGVAVAVPGVERDELLRRADAAMYDAKRAGKGRVARFVS